MFPRLLELGDLPGLSEDLTPKQCIEKVGLSLCPVPCLEEDTVERGNDANQQPSSGEENVEDVQPKNLSVREVKNRTGRDRAAHSTDLPVRIVNNRTGRNQPDESTSKALLRKMDKMMSWMSGTAEKWIK